MTRRPPPREPGPEAGVGQQKPRYRTVVVSYADPTPGDDDVALQDLAGNDLASFTATATNNSAVEPVPALPLTGAGLLGLLLILLGGRRRPSG